MMCVSELTTAYLVAKLSGRWSEGATLCAAVAIEFVSNCVLRCFVNRTKCSDFCALTIFFAAMDNNTKTVHL
jgi:hypothetical protein